MIDPGSAGSSATAAAALFLLESLIWQLQRSGQISAGALHDLYRDAGRMALQLDIEQPGSVGLAAAQILAAFAASHSQ